MDLRELADLMFPDVTETVEDIAYLTEQLAQVRYNIESMESQLRTYDNLVDYATVDLEISEVEVYTPVAPVEQHSI